MQDNIKALLEAYREPHADKTLKQLKAIKNIKVNDDHHVSVDLEFGFPCAQWHQSLIEELQQVVHKEFADVTLDVSIKTLIKRHETQNTEHTLTRVKNIIAVASGKGGVGKSTVTSNLAAALMLEGAKVGIVDADIYGPSQPRMLGVQGKPVSEDGKTMNPLVSHGIEVNSIGFLIEEDTPMIWRGPMVTQALKQLALETNWGLSGEPLDYLIIDLPPGTGDIQLTLAQRIPVNTAVVVTTPQDIALLDAKKAYKMFEKVKISVTGVIENMSVYHCPQCGHSEHIFGHGGGQAMAAQYNIDFLGQLPLDIQMREDADQGTPTVIKHPQLPASLIYQQIARKVAARIAAEPINYGDVFPQIKITDVKPNK